MKGSGQNQKIRLHDITLNTRVDGKAGKPWVIFSNSLLTDLSMWDEEVLALADRFHILRYDQRGHGCSDVPSQACSFSQLADDVVGLMDHFNIAEAAFVGISMGCVTGLALAARYPNRIRRMLLCDGPAQSPQEAPALWQSRFDFARNNGMAALVKLTLQRWFGAYVLVAPSARMLQLQHAMERTPIQGFMACAEALKTFNYSADLPTIAIPTLLLAGATDYDLPTAMAAMAKTMPQAKFRKIMRAGHLPNIQQPALFLACLEEALAYI